MLFNKTKQYNIHIFDKILFFKCRTRHISKLLNWNGSLTKMKVKVCLMSSLCYFTLNFLIKVILIRQLGGGGGGGV